MDLITLQNLASNFIHCSPFMFKSGSGMGFVAQPT